MGFRAIGRTLQQCRSFCNSGAVSLANRAVTLNCSDGVAVFGLNRPEVKNAINFQVLNELRDAIEFVKFNKAVHVAILYSTTAGIFCAGADLKERYTLLDNEYRRWSVTIRGLTSLLADLPMPVLAALDGHALGGGLELALACDLRVASCNIKLGLPETGLGIIPGAGGTQRLPRIVGPSVAKELIFTCRILTGEQARHLGIVNETVDQNAEGDAAFQRCLSVSQNIAEKGRVPLQMAKLSVNAGNETELHTGLSIESSCHALGELDELERSKSFDEKGPLNSVGE